MYNESKAPFVTDGDHYVEEFRMMIRDKYYPKNICGIVDRDILVESDHYGFETTYRVWNEERKKFDKLR